MDFGYYVNVYELMVNDLPRPRLKGVFIRNHDEVLPLIDGSTGEIVKC